MKLLYCIAILFLMNSCVKDKPQDPLKTAVSINSDNKVLVINEGLYPTGNGSISLYDSESNDVVTDIYFQQNNAYLGNVVQSITKYNNNYYVVVNNSNKIVVINPTNFIKTATISGFNSPRYMLPITFNKAYVSDLYANSIQILDLNSNAISGSIGCMKGTQEMALIYNKAFITNDNSNYCYVVNTANDIITDSINIGIGGSSIVIDKNSKIWVLTSGNSLSSQTGKLVRINPLSLQIEQSLSFNSGESPFKLCINKTRDTLHYLNNGVNQFLISSTSLPSNQIINQGTKTYYGLGINPKDYSIYVSDANDFTQKSTIEIYKPNGNFKTSFKAGNISNSFMFE
jgi:hypothetical protein